MDWSKYSNRKYIFYFFQLSCLALLIGRGWQFLSKSHPFNAFFFHHEYMNPIVEFVYKIDWKEYLTNPEWHNMYKKIVNGFAIFLLIGICFIVGIRSIKLLFSKIYFWLVFLLLFLLAGCYYLESGYRLGQFIEYSLQFSTPLLFLYFYQHYMLSDRINISHQFINILKFLIALTFIGHGLFAIGYYPIPGKFVDMMIKGFSVSEDGAKQILLIVGVLDIVAAILIFIPKGKLLKYSLWYIILWGLLTSLARVYTNFDWGLGWYSLKQWLPELLMRFPHFVVPFVLLLILKKEKIIN